MGIWVYILILIVGVAAFILIMTVLSNLVITWAASRYSSKTLNTTIAELETLLPGKNCGACGCESCTEYAQAVFRLQKDTDCCVEGDPELSQKLNAVMDKFQKQLEDDTPKKED